MGRGEGDLGALLAPSSVGARSAEQVAERKLEKLRTSSSPSVGDLQVVWAHRELLGEEDISEAALQALWDTAARELEKLQKSHPGRLTEPDPDEEWVEGGMVRAQEVFEDVAESADPERGLWDAVYERRARLLDQSLGERSLQIQWALVARELCEANTDSAPPLSQAASGALTDSEACATAQNIRRAWIASVGPPALVNGKAMIRETARSLLSDEEVTDICADSYSRELCDRVAARFPEVLGADQRENPGGLPMLQAIYEEADDQFKELVIERLKRSEEFLSAEWIAELEESEELKESEWEIARRVSERLRGALQISPQERLEGHLKTREFLKGSAGAAVWERMWGAASKRSAQLAALVALNRALVRGAAEAGE